MVLQLWNVLLPLKMPDFKVLLRLPWDLQVLDRGASAQFLDDAYYGKENKKTLNW